MRARHGAPRSPHSRSIRTAPIPAIVGVAHQGGDACQKVADLFNYMNMQLGTWVAGGNPTLGQGGTLGGLGHFSVGVRANVMKATIPRSTTSRCSRVLRCPRNIPSNDKWVGLPAVGCRGRDFSRAFRVGAHEHWRHRCARERVVSAELHAALASRRRAERQVEVRLRRTRSASCRSRCSFPASACRTWCAISPRRSSAARTTRGTP